MAWTAPASFSVGEIVTSTKLNTHVRDNLKAMAPVDYEEITASVTFSGGSSASSSAIIDGNAITYEARPILVEFWVPQIASSSNTYIAVCDGTTHVATIFFNSGSTFGTGSGAARFTPSAGSHTYQIRGWTDSASATVYAGAAGGSGAWAPAFMRIRYDEF